MKEDPPTDPDLCPCVNDVTANGILTEMVHIAKSLKYLARQPRAKQIPQSFRYVFSYPSTIGPIRREVKQRGKRNIPLFQLSTIPATYPTTPYPIKYLALKPRAKQIPQITDPELNLILETGRQRSKRNVENTTEMIAQYQQEYLDNSSPENAFKIMELNPWKPKTLVGPKQWVSFEALLTWSMLDEEELNNFAVFMYCKLNQPELDRAKDLFD
eukprot:GFUD01098667.1.p1 GENE.GFUD01098667.1~~GFUD01098667.1.p1  ORF type:complete len:214 (+),score=48.48 GFUD01098667.1:2-643(+)